MEAARRAHNSCYLMFITRFSEFWIKILSASSHFILTLLFNFAEIYLRWPEVIDCGKWAYDQNRESWLLRAHSRWMKMLPCSDPRRLWECDLNSRSALCEYNGNIKWKPRQWQNINMQHNLSPVSALACLLLLFAGKFNWKQHERAKFVT